MQHSKSFTYINLLKTQRNLIRQVLLSSHFCRSYNCKVTEPESGKDRIGEGRIVRRLLNNLDEW